MVAFTGPEHHLRAKGNLDYLQFIRLVQRYWSEAHPDIPIIPTGGDKPAQYPCIIYGLEVRQTPSGEPKAKHRERIDDLIITGQKFDNMVSFSAVAEANPNLCEEIIEEFENWMLEMIPVFKELGVSELTYGRRLPDSEVSRRGFGVTARAVVFHVRTEKVRATSFALLKSIVVDARTKFLAADQTSDIGNAYTSISPRYYGSIPIYEIVGDTISIPQTNFIVGDVIYVAAKTGDFKPGFYMVGNTTEASGPPFADDRFYYLGYVPDEGEEFVPITISGTGKGRVFYMPDRDVDLNITDEHKGTSTA